MKALGLLFVNFLFAADWMNTFLVIVCQKMCTHTHTHIHTHTPSIARPSKKGDQKSSEARLGIPRIVGGQRDFLLLYIGKFYIEKQIIASNYYKWFEFKLNTR